MTEFSFFSKQHKELAFKQTKLLYQSHRLRLKAVDNIKTIDDALSVLGQITRLTHQCKEALLAHPVLTLSVTACTVYFLPTRLKKILSVTVSAASFLQRSRLTKLFLSVWLPPQK